MDEKEPAAVGQDPASGGHDPKTKNPAHEGRTLHWTRVAAVLTGVGAVGTLVFGIASACGSDDPSTPDVSQKGTGNNYCTEGSTCPVNVTQVQQIVQDAESVAGSNDTEMRKQLRAAPDATKPPTGSGPYPFLVVDTGDLGLFARTSNVVNGVRVGNSGNHELVWADCMEQSDFTPSDVSGETNVGPLWVQVRWKHLDGGQVRGLSEPNETQTAWMYRGDLEPVGHNGDIPTC
ncbi:hypothetical protein [Actinophytocola sp.]|uniref:hypothetical protein n=1 Tax=Actinophytocola sp. TaxID=1872138 RepID=UPI002ED66E50